MIEDVKIYIAASGKSAEKMYLLLRETIDRPWQVQRRDSPKQAGRLTMDVPFEIVVSILTGVASSFAYDGLKNVWRRIRKPINDVMASSGDSGSVRVLYRKNGKEITQEFAIMELPESLEEDDTVG